MFYSKYKGRVAKLLMNKMGYDAMAVGNHEFDDGPQNLASFIKKSKFPVLSANIDASKDKYLKGLILPYSLLLCMPSVHYIRIIIFSRTIWESFIQYIFIKLIHCFCVS